MSPEEREAKRAWRMRASRRLLLAAFVLQLLKGLALVLGHPH